MVLRALRRSDDIIDEVVGLSDDTIALVSVQGRPTPSPAARCCVLIPYFESGDLLIRSLLSIDGLGEGRVDVLVVDDGSLRRPARNVIDATVFRDRVGLLELASNVGIAAALNQGLSRLMPHYEYVARLDCGDTCCHERLSAQMAYLDTHRKCALVGTWASFLSMSGEERYTVRHPTEHRQIMRRMHINSAFTHSAVMFRSDLVRSVGLYPENRAAAEDHAYFFKIGSKFETANIPQVHVRSILDPAGISAVRRRRQLVSRIAILVENFDFRPGSFYGVLRAILQLSTPRAFTVSVRSGLHRLRQPRQPGGRTC